jgi:hypothetical protein
MQTIGSDLDALIAQYPPIPFAVGEAVWCQFRWPTFGGRRFPALVESWWPIASHGYRGVARVLIDGYWYRLPVMPADVRTRASDAVPLRDDFGRGAFDEERPRRRRTR